MKEAIKPPFIIMLLICITAALALLGYAKENVQPSSALVLSSDEKIVLSDTTQAILLPKANEFNGVLVIDDKVEHNHSKIKEKEFTKRVKKMVIRKNATPEDVKKYGTNALNGIMFITTNEK